MLTKREIEVLLLQKKIIQQKDIAKKLKISQPAVSLFERNIKRKLNDAVMVLELIKEMGIKYDDKKEELKFIKC